MTQVQSSEQEWKEIISGIFLRDFLMDWGMNQENPDLPTSVGQAESEPGRT